MKSPTDLNEESLNSELAELNAPLLEFLFWFIAVFEIDYSYTHIKLSEFLIENNDSIFTPEVQFDNWENGTKFLDSFNAIFRNERCRELILQHSKKSHSYELQQFISNYFNSNSK